MKIINTDGAFALGQALCRGLRDSLVQCQNKPRIIISPLTFSSGNLSTERFTDLPKIAQLARSGA